MASIELTGINKKFEDEKNLFSFAQINRSARAKVKGISPEQQEKAPFSLLDVNLKIPNGKTIVILGPSGCGKTTLLKIIAGLQTYDTGSIRFDGVEVGDLKPGERRIGMVFQNYALIPHFTTDENILSYFKFRKKTPELDAEAEEKFKRTSELMGVDITHLLGRMPKTLSGGERQRVALARCITRDPSLFLMDEPFSNLDVKLREKFRVNLKWLLRQFRITTVYVTHDQHEAQILADLVAIMKDGVILQTGTFQEIYESPKNLFVAEFLNLDYETISLNKIKGETIAPRFAGKIIAVRPEKIKVLSEPQEGSLKGRVAYTLYYPLRDKTVVMVSYVGQEVQMIFDGKGSFEDGDPIDFAIERFNAFEVATGERSFS